MDTEASLDSLGILEGTDKGSLGHGYLRHYERILGSLRDERFTLLEIGVARGGSLRTWESYFHNATIVGVDILPHSTQYAGGRRIVEVGSQADPVFLDRIGKKYWPRVIVDDGSHRADHILLTFEKLYPCLQEGGIYIVEDVHFHAGRFAETHRGAAKIVPQQYFLQLANRVVCPQEDIDFDTAIVQATEGVEFFYGGIAIRRRVPRERDPITPRRALVETASKPEMWGAFAMLIMNSGGDLAEALRAVHSAIELAPKEAGHRHQLSIILERMGDLPGAIAASKEAVQLHPNQVNFVARLSELEAKVPDLR